MTSKTATKATNTFDVMNFSTSKKSKEGAIMPFLNPVDGQPLEHQAEGDKEPRALHLVLMGASSGEAQRVFKQLQNRYNRRGEKHVPSDDDLEADRLADAKAVARLTVGGLLFSGGKWVELDKDNAGDFLYAIDPLRQQAVNFIKNAGNFIAS